MTPENPGGQTQLKWSLTLKQKPPLEHGLKSQVKSADVDGDVVNLTNSGVVVVVVVVGVVVVEVVVVVVVEVVVGVVGSVSWQMTPENPGGQTQLKWSESLTHEPPLLHGLKSQTPG